MKKLLITGGAGFIGSSICLKLKEKYPGYVITAFDNLKRRGSELNLTDFKKLGIDFIHGDIRNIEDLDTAGRFDILIDASAEASVLAGLNTNPRYIINNNLYGSINCFNACLKNRAQLIFLSTSRVYPFQRIEQANYVEEETRFSFAENQLEKGISKSGISEELSLEGSRSFYGTTKLSSELFIREYSEFYGLQAAITRFGVVAGPRQFGKADQGVVTLWMAKHFWNQSLKYIGYGGTGKQVRDILHIDDLVRLTDLQIHNMDKFNGNVFNAGGGIHSSLSLVEMTRICSEITGNKIPIKAELQTRPADLRIYITDNEKIKQHTGWEPARGTKEILYDIFLWLKNNETKLKPVLLS
jgi:CDP-paratose 2-epimerase